MKGSRSLQMERILHAVFVLSNLLFGFMVVAGLVFSLYSHHSPPSIVNDHFSEGNLLALQGKLGEASEEFRSYVALIPQDYQGFAALGDVLSRNREWNSAIQALERAIALNPGSDRVHYLLGIAYLSLIRSVSEGVDADDYLANGRQHLSEAARLGYPVDLAVMKRAGLRD